MPSRKILYLIIALLVAGGLILFSVQKTAPVAYTNPIATSTALIIESSLARTSGTDTDQDGLKDWEEVLWKTDPNKADTDQDGVSDGEEVSKGKDPSVKGSGTQGKTTNSVTTEPENLTETEKFSRAFFEQYLLSKQKNGTATIDAQTQARLVEELTVKQGDFTAVTYTEADLLIVPNETVSLKQYGNTVGRSLRNNVTPPNQDHEVDIFQVSLATERSQDVAKLSPIIDSYTGTIKDLLDIRVPSNAVTIHLKLINSMSAVKESIVAMRGFFEDPVKSLGAIGAYSTNVDALVKAFTEVRLFFSQNNVTFQQPEDGYIVTQPL